MCYSDINGIKAMSLVKVSGLLDVGKYQIGDYRAWPSHVIGCSPTKGLRDLRLRLKLWPFYHLYLSNKLSNAGVSLNKSLVQFRHLGLVETKKLGAV